MPKGKTLTAAHVQSTASPTTSTTAPAPSTLAESRLLRRPEVEALTGLCTSAIYAGMARGTFPKSIPLGARAVGWRARDIAAFLEHGAAGVRNDGE